MKMFCYWKNIRSGNMKWKIDDENMWMLLQFCGVARDSWADSLARACIAIGTIFKQAHPSTEDRMGHSTHGKVRRDEVSIWHENLSYEKLMWERTASKTPKSFKKLQHTSFWCFESLRKRNCIYTREQFPVLQSRIVTHSCRASIIFQGKLVDSIILIEFSLCKL